MSNDKLKKAWGSVDQDFAQHSIDLPENLGP